MPTDAHTRLRMDQTGVVKVQVLLNKVSPAQAKCVRLNTKGES